MMNTYRYPQDKDMRLSEHFQVWEFVAQSDYDNGRYPSEVPIHDKLLEILEAVYAHFGCDCGVICSGYRTPECDLSVGGSGSGPHTLGIAADVYYYKNGDPVPSRLVACYLQDMGIKGIGLNCGGNVNGTHIDMRGFGVWEDSFWHGDESVRDDNGIYQTVSNFYAYTKTTKEEVYPVTRQIINPTGKRGVDVGGHNGDIDLAAVKAAGYDFVMIKLGYGSDDPDQDDSQFEANVRKAESLGMPWGAWLYSYALNDAEAKSELDHILRRLKGKRPTMPIALDVEDSDNYRKNHGGWNYQTVNSCTKIVLEGLEKSGYYPMLYTGFEEIENYISEAVYIKYDMWFAHWAGECGYKGSNLGIWQYGGETNVIESNSIDGVGVIDKDMCYKDYPTIIKNGGWNNWNGDPSDDSQDDADDDIPYGYGVRAVQEVQEWLNSAFDAGLEIDGIYGRLTKKALICALQTILNRDFGAELEVDGIFGGQTKKAIRNLTRGDYGDYVRVLQGFLISLGYDTGGFDGDFGYMTEASVLTFQTVRGLFVDGVAGKCTFEELANG